MKVPFSAVGSETFVTSQRVFSTDENEDELMRNNAGHCGLLAAFFISNLNPTVPRRSSPVTV